jgi:hypothetical protein
MSLVLAVAVVAYAAPGFADRGDALLAIPYAVKSFLWIGLTGVQIYLVASGIAPSTRENDAAGIVSASAVITGALSIPSDAVLANVVAGNARDLKEWRSVNAVEDALCTAFLLFGAYGVTAQGGPVGAIGAFYAAAAMFGAMTYLDFLPFPMEVRWHAERNRLLRADPTPGRGSSPGGMQLAVTWGVEVGESTPSLYLSPRLVGVVRM